MTTIAIIDDHTLVREGLRMILDDEVGFTVVGEASNPAEAFSLVERTAPDVALVDVRLGDADAIPLLRGLGVRYPATRTLVLTMHDDGETVRQAFLAGASGYLVKGAARADLLAAVRAVARGERYVHSAVAGTMLDDSLRWLRKGEVLSPREREVLRLIAGGRTAVEASAMLGISAHTVRRHVANLATKLGVRGRAALVRYALEHDMVGSRH
ncbi:MAG: response regulator transcription factor [Gemmatimonadales bacterium]